MITMTRRAHQGGSKDLGRFREKAVQRLRCVSKLSPSAFSERELDGISLWQRVLDSSLFGYCGRLGSRSISWLTVMGFSPSSKAPHKPLRRPKGFRRTFIRRLLLCETLEQRQLMAADVFTDKADYAPGSTAIITATNNASVGQNFLAGETIKFQVVHTDEIYTNQYESWKVTDGWTGGAFCDLEGVMNLPDLDGIVNGEVKTTWDVGQIPDSTLELTATGLASGAVATTTFTDALGTPYVLNSAASSTSSSQLGMFLNAAVPKGNTVILSVAYDPDATTDLFVEDSKFNTWTKNWDNRYGTGTSGVRMAVFSAPISNALTTSDSVTVYFGTLAQRINIQTKVMSALAVSGLGSVVVKNADAGNIGTSTSPDSNVTGTNYAGGSSLLIGLAAIESGWDNPFTVKAGTGWTAIGASSSGNAVNASNISLNPFYKSVGGTNYKIEGTIPTSAAWMAGLVSYQADLIAPTVAITSGLASLRAGQTTTLTFTFSEKITDGIFDASDITLESGSIGTVTKVSDSVYTVLYTPAANTADAAVNISVAAGRFQDWAANNNAAAASLNIAVDTILPTIAITSNKSALKAGETATITFTLSEAATDFVAGDVVVTGGSLSAFSGSGTLYSATFTPTANSTANGVISVASGMFTDAAGNSNADGADANNTVTISVDSVHPTVAITSPVSKLKVGQTTTLTFTFSEDINDASFDSSKITLESGSVGVLNKVSETVYTAVYTPAPVTLDAAMNISIAVGAFEDVAGNLNTAAASLNIAIDTRPQAAVIKGISTDTGISSTDGRTSDNTLIFRGTAEPSSTVKLYSATAAAPTPVLLGETTTNALSNWTFDYTATPIADGTYSITAEVTVGTEQVLSPVFVLMVDTASPEITAMSGAGSITELPDGHPDETTGSSTTSGTIAFQDRPETAVHVMAVTSIGTNYIGFFEVDDTPEYVQGVGTVFGTIYWTFNVANADIDYLAEGQQIVQHYLVRITDYTDPTLFGEATVTITITGTNDGPEAVSDGPFTGEEDSVITGNVATNDSGNNLTYFALAPANGTVVMYYDGTFKYVPDPNFIGSDSFTYRAIDGRGGMASATVSLTVTAVDDAAVAVNDFISTVNRATVLFDLLVNDSDIDGPAPAIESFTTTVSGVSEVRTATGTYDMTLGELTFLSNQTFYFEPFAGSVGLDTFSYKLVNGGTATVTISLASKNDPPVISGATTATISGATASGSITGVSDPDGDDLNFLLKVLPANGSVMLTASGEFVYTPGGSFTGTDSFQYRVFDSRGAATVGFVNIGTQAGSGPTVDRILVNSTLWSPSFRTGPAGLGDSLGFVTANSSSSSNNLPWINLNQINVQFGPGVSGSSVDLNDFVLTGVAGVRKDGMAGIIPRIVSLTFDSVSNVATLNLDQSMDASTLTLQVRGNGIYDTQGIAMGADYSHVLAVLPGDVNRSGTVTTGSAVTSDQYDIFRDVYSVFVDVNGSYAIDLDASLIAARSGSRRS